MRKLKHFAVRVWGRNYVSVVLQILCLAAALAAVALQSILSSSLRSSVYSLHSAVFSLQSSVFALRCANYSD